MPTDRKRQRYDRPDPRQAPVLEYQQTLSAPGATAPQRFVGDVIVTYSGTATRADVRVERASTLFSDNLTTPGIWVPADNPPFTFTVTPSVGADIAAFEEPTVGWWRVRVLEAIGGEIIINIAGGVL